MPNFNLANLTKNSPTLHTLVLVAIINLAALAFLDDTTYRLCRLVTGVCAFAYFHMYIKVKRLWAYLLFTAIIISDIGMMLYERQFASNLYRMSLITTFVILSVAVFKNILWKQISLFEYFTYVFMFLFCAFVFDFTVSNIADLFPDSSCQITIYITGIVGLITCLLFAFYNVVHTSFNSAYITYGVFTLALSNYNALVAYYYQTNAVVFYVLERTMYIVAIYCILRHIFETQKLKMGTEINPRISSLDSVGF
jgi:hypothetical protein